MPSSRSRELGRGVHHLLEVVEQEQHPALADVLGEAVLGAERLRDRLGDQRRIAQRRQRDPEDAGREVAGTSSAAASIASRVLPVPPGPVSVTSRAPFRAARRASSTLPLAADERGRRARQVRVRDRLQRREALSPSWKIATGSSKSLSRCSPRSRSPALAEPAGCRRDDAPARRAPTPRPGRQVDVVAHVALIGQRRVPVWTPIRTWIGPPARPSVILARGRDGPRRRRRTPEEGVALGVDLDAAVCPAGLADDPAMLRQGGGVCLRAELVEQPASTPRCR